MLDAILFLLQERTLPTLSVTIACGVVLFISITGALSIYKETTTDNTEEGGMNDQQ
jgi:hypothetical protein